MPKQTTIPRTPEEIAMCLSQLTKDDRRWLDGVIVGLTTARTTAPPSAPAEPVRPSA